MKTAYTHSTKKKSHNTKNAADSKNRKHCAYNTQYTHIKTLHSVILSSDLRLIFVLFHCAIFS